MVHQYKNNGYNMVLDVASGSVHVVDDLTYEVIALYEDHTLEEIIKELSSWDEKDVKESYGEVTELKDAGVLFTEDCYEEYICGFKDRPTVVKALCLHIAHDCNLACRYCFAEEGEYKGRRALMSAEVGKKALDFLVENSGNRRNLEVDFFGGEPLMNFDVVKEIVAYGRDLEKTHDKKFRFTLTTNGVLLNDDIMEFANKEMDNVVLSVDGRKEVHDFMRPFRNGKGSYDFIIDKFKKFADSRNQQKYYVRGTFTHHNLDFSKDVMHLADEGFEQISVEPVVAPDTADYAIKEEDLPKIMEEYDLLAKEMIKREKEGKEFTVTLSTNTIYSYIKKGIFLNITMEDLPEKKKQHKKKKVKVQKRVQAGDSISQRPEHIDFREEFGHWEMDTVVGGQRKSKKSLLVLTERKTRKELIHILSEHTMCI